MKKFSSIMLCSVLLTMAIAAGAFAFKGSGNGFPTYGQSGGTVFYGDGFAPTTGTVVALGTKSVTAVAVDSLTSYKFFFTKVSDNTSVLGKVFFGQVATWGAAGGVPTAGDGPWHPGKDLKYVTFAPFSSATPVQVTIYKQ